MGVGDLSSQRRAAVFFDRDGTLNRAFERNGVSHPPATVGELDLLPGVPEVIARLKQSAFLIVVITNQPDVARGTLRRDEAELINARLRQWLPGIDALQCCYHDDVDQCACRKPQPGMLIEAAQRFNLDLTASFVIGDSWRDTEAGRRAGCATIQVAGLAAAPSGVAPPDYWATDVTHAAEIVLGLRTQEAAACSGG